MHEKVRSDSGMNEPNLLIAVTYTPTYKINEPSLENDQNRPKSKRGRHHQRKERSNQRHLEPSRQWQ